MKQIKTLLRKNFVSAAAEIKIPVKKLKSGFGMPVFGIGTWEMGGEFEHDQDNDDKADVAAIKTAIDLGVTHIDTAEIYADGYAEKLVGRAIKEYDRSKLFIVSKVEPENFGYKKALRSCERSLERLRTSYLDLYLLHWYEEGVSLKETMRALDKLVERGSVRNIGVSNFGVERLKEAQSYSKNKIVCDQVHYNLIVREPERKSLLKYCQKNDIIMTAYRPLEKGGLANDPPRVLREIANKYKKTPAQVAINWLISQKNVVAIAKSRNIEHLKENMGAIGWNMDKKDIGILCRDFPDQKDESDVASLN